MSHKNNRDKIDQNPPDNSGTKISISILIAAVLIGGALFFANRGSGSPEASANNVTVTEGKQIVEITARGGYSPRKSIAKAGIPTILRVETNGTFDCSASIRIPSMNVGKILPQTGTTDFELGSPIAGTLRGSCGMGMYPFEIEFVN